MLVHHYYLCLRTNYGLLHLDQDKMGYKPETPHKFMLRHCKTIDYSFLHHDTFQEAALSRLLI